MATKIYKVIINILSMDDGENIITSTIFLDRDLALEYYKDLVNEDKKLDFNPEHYVIDEENTSYERYLENRALEDSISIWMEEDEICEELEKESKKDKNNDKEKEPSYEM